MSQEEEEVANPATDAGLIADIEKRYKSAKNATQDWRKEAMEDYDFVASDQWTDQDRAKLKEQLRPEVTFNRVHPVVETVVGLEISNRQETRYIPRTAGAAQVNEILTGAAKWVRDECNAEDEESQAFRDMVTCGVGCTETRLDYEDEPDGRILIERIDPLEMYWDPDCVKQNFIDARWVMRVRDVPLDWVQAQWPDKRLELSLNTTWLSDNSELLNAKSHPENPADAYSEGGTDGKDKKGLIRLVDYQWKEYEPAYLVRDDVTGRERLMDADTFDVIRVRAEALGMPLVYVPQKICRRNRVFASGQVVLEITKTPCPYAFTYQFLTAYKDRNRSNYYGIVRNMKDPQRWANKWLAQSMHIINSNAKGGLLAEKSAFDNIRDAETTWAKPESITVLRDGALTKGQIKEKPVGQYPQGTNELMGFAVKSISDVTGVNSDALGMADRDQPAMLEFQRKQSAVTILSTLFDSLRRYRKEHGRMLLHLIQEYISDERLIRITGQKGPEYIPLVKDDATAKYDVIIDDAPTSPNEKQRVWELLVQVLPILPTIGLPLIPELLDYVPLPASLVQTWKGYIEQMNQPNPNDQLMKQLQPVLIKAMADQATGEAAQAQANAAKAAADAQLKTAQAQAQNPQIEAMKSLAEMTKVQAEARKILSEIGSDPVKQAAVITELAKAAKTYAEAQAVPSRESNEAPNWSKARKDLMAARDGSYQTANRAGVERMKAFADAFGQKDASPGA